MKHFQQYIVVGLFLTIITQIYTQPIIKRVQSYVLFRIESGATLNIGDELSVYRDDVLSGRIQIGTIRIAKVVDNQYAGKVMNEADDSPVKAGDYIDLSARDESGSLDSGLSFLDELIQKEFTILKRVQSFALLDATPSDGILLGETFDVKRRNNEQQQISIGKIKIHLFQNNQCAVRIIEETPGYQIGRNDYIDVALGGGADHAWQGEQTLSRPDHVSQWSIGLGCLAAAIGYYSYNQANQSYDQYEAATTSQDAVRLFDESEMHANRANVGLGIGGGLVVFGLVYKLITHPPKANPTRYSLAPYQKPDASGLTLQFALR